MKILKVKLLGKYCYPATIAQAVKDANFKKNGNIPMTLGEVNLYLYNAISISSIDVDEDGFIYYEKLASSTVTMDEEGNIFFEIML